MFQQYFNAGLDGPLTSLTATRTATQVTFLRIWICQRSSWYDHILVIGNCGKTLLRVGYPPIRATLAFAPTITHVTSLSIMAAVALDITGRSSQQPDLIRSDNVADNGAEKGSERFPGDNDGARFFQDNSNTGARILGE